MPLPEPLDGPEDLTDPLRARSQLVGVEAHVQLGEVESEHFGAAAQGREPAVRDPAAAVLSQATVEEVEVGPEGRGRDVARLTAVLDRVPEPPPDERELAPVRLVGVLAADLREVAGQRCLVRPERGLELGQDGHETARDGERPGELAHLVAVPGEDERPRLLQRLRDRLRPGGRVSVHVAANPASERERARRRGKLPPVPGEHALRRVEQALLEEPEAAPDLVADSGPPGAHLVRLPEHRHLLGQRGLDRLAPVVSLEELGEPQVSGERASPRGLGGVRGEDELEGDVSRLGRELRRRNAAGFEPLERLGQRLAGCLPLSLVGAPATEPVMLLGDVGELEVEAERAQDLRLARDRESAELPGQLGSPVLVTGGPDVAGEQADSLLGLDQLGAFLLDEHPSEQLPEQADVAPQRGFRVHGAQRTRSVG